jgi:hypothetical protein
MCAIKSEIGLPSTLSAVMTIPSIMALTAAAGGLGVAAIAGVVSRNWSDAIGEWASRPLDDVATSVYRSVPPPASHFPPARLLRRNQEQTHREASLRRSS